MKNKGLLLTASSLLVLLATIITMSCNKKFDEPPATPVAPVDTSISNNIVSIKTLKSLHTIGGLEQISKNYVISGVVGGSDESGNLYKIITIQDSTGGITLTLDRSGLYNDYPVGRKLYIKCQGLYISDYNHNIQLGVLDNTVPSNPALTSIPSSLFDNYIIKGTLGNTVTPKIVTLSQLKSMAGISAASIPSKDTLQSTLIQLNNVELNSTDVGYVYADTSSAKKSVSRNLTDCIGTTGVVLYSSGYASFAGFPVPTGKGTLLGIFTPYNTTAEIEIRDTSDVQFNDIRCGAAVAKTLFSETFAGITTATTITSGTDNVWQNIAEVGGVSFQGYVSGSSHYATASGYGAAGSPSVIASWMITPTITIPSTITSPTLTFVSNDAYFTGGVGATFQVLVSTNYNGSSTPSKSTWTVLPATIPSGDATFPKTTTSSGAVDLSAYIGKTIYLAWRYTTTSAAQTGSKYEFGNVQVVGY